MSGSWQGVSHTPAGCAERPASGSSQACFCRGTLVTQRSRLAWEHTFVQSHETNRKGAVAELALAKELAKLGMQVLAPMTEHARYDLAFAFGNRLVRVQCKWARIEGDIALINLAGYRYTH